MISLLACAISLIMAGFCILNTGMLIVVCTAGLHALGDRVDTNLINTSGAGKVIKFLADAKRSAFIVVCYLLRNFTVPITILLSVLFLAFLVNKGSGNNTSQLTATKETGGFYFGIYNPEVQEKNSLQPITQWGKEQKKNNSIISIYLSWGPESISDFPRPLLNGISGSGSIPMITWEPWVSTFPARSDFPELKQEKKVMAAIADGKFDEYIRSFALKIRDFRKPVFIRFAHEFDNPAYPWSRTGGNTPREYVAAWRKIAAVFAAIGVNNVAWVWNPWNKATMREYYPGDQYVDWVGLTSLNYGLASQDKKWRSFEEIYNPHREAILKIGKPVMLAEFGSTNYGGNSHDWILKAWGSINEKYHEIKSLVLFNSNKDKNWITAWRPTDSTKFIDWTAIDIHKIFSTFNQDNRAAKVWEKQKHDHVVPNRQKSDFADKKMHLKSLKVEGKPFYIKGIAYNPGHDWRDGYYPLSRKRLEMDFEAIKAMGCNTIRRYHPSIYDKNIFNSAKKNGLKIVYGFWFDPKVDYYKDTSKVKSYINDVLKTVNKYKDEHSILIWDIGNETSGLLKKHFEQPYLHTVRDAFMNMIETLAQSIRRIDPGHPIITTLEHSWQLPGELLAYHEKVPSIDFMGINSYYEEQLSTVNILMAQFDSSRSYLITEFGPKGYWNSDWTDMDKYDNLVEDTDFDKAKLYVKQWQEHILMNKKSNIGGIAYCWQDRFEGTNTWFGITDYKGRKKQVYFALKSSWINNGKAFDSTKLFIVGPHCKLSPGAFYSFIAKCSEPKYKNFEWLLLTENFKEISRKTTTENIALIKIPVKLDNYRLYVYVSSENGRVITASKSLVIYKGIHNAGL